MEGNWIIGEFLWMLSVVGLFRIGVIEGWVVVLDLFYIKYSETVVVTWASILATEVEWIKSIKADLVDLICAEYVMAAGNHHRSIVWQMLLKKSSNSLNMGSLKEHIDSSMMGLYPHNCVYKMAMLAKQCVDEDPILRPDMKQDVISLPYSVIICKVGGSTGRKQSSF